MILLVYRLKARSSGSVFIPTLLITCMAWGGTVFHMFFRLFYDIYYILTEVKLTYSLTFYICSGNKVFLCNLGNFIILRDGGGWQLTGGERNQTTREGGAEQMRRK